ncbi:MAG: helicase C-terminal domain-containing protein, partial [Dehalococcoidia bacterium]|nr:helicase C-terminal domain-containing protein [Dehalococcoidia bacterium]
DEAHHLEEEATKQWGLRLDREELAGYLTSLLEDLPGRKRTGLLLQVSSYLRGKPASQRGEAQQTLERLEAAVLEARHLVEELFRLLDPLVKKESGDNEDGYRLRLTRQVLGSTSWAALVRTHEALSRSWVEIEEGLGSLYIVLGQGEDIADEVSNRRQEGQALRRNLAALISEPPEGTVRWAALESQGRGDCLCSAPLHVGQLLQEQLFSNKEAVILTSATLTTEGTFEHLKERLGLCPNSEVLLGSPFDYKSSTLLWIAQDLPDPGNYRYQANLEQALVELLTATEGHALVLFTAHSALRAVLSNIRGPLERERILVLGHGVDGSRTQLLETFKRYNTPTTSRLGIKGAVLLGTSSFWEGVDVVGDALRIVVITRLPFYVPTDPVFAARSQSFTDGFNQYALPLSILRFRQGFGRLIRSRSDRGVMVVLDSRLHRKTYGRAFLQSLPRCTVRVGPARDLPGEASRWLLSFQTDLL